MRRQELVLERIAFPLTRRSPGPSKLEEHQMLVLIM
jgi:hypothetical protein